MREQRVRLKLLPEQRDLPKGPTYQCTACGARVRRGSPHAGLKPFVHNILDALVATEEKEKR